MSPAFFWKCKRFSTQELEVGTQKSKKARKKDTVGAAHFLWAADCSSTWETTEKDSGDWTFYALCKPADPWTKKKHYVDTGP